METRNQFLGFLEAKNVALRPSEASTQGFDLEKKKKNPTWTPSLVRMGEGGGRGSFQISEPAGPRDIAAVSCVQHLWGLYPEAMSSE